MAATDISVVEATLKEGWTQDNLEAQFLKTDELMKQLGVKDPDQMIGEKALTGVHTGRGGGVSMIGPNGSSSTNAPDGQKTAQAQWTLRRAFNAIEIDTAAIKRTGNNSQAVAKVVDTEVSGTVSDTQKQIVRQLVTDGSGFIAACNDTEGAKKVIPLATTGTYGLGIEATRQQWLPIGQVVDIGTAEDEDNLIAGTEITAYDNDETTPTITIGEEKDTVEAAKYFVSIANSRSGTTSYSINGFRSIANSTASVAFGGLKEEDQPGWAPAFVDTTGGAITAKRVKAGRRKVRQRGTQPDWAWTSLKQLEALENDLFPQVRYDSPSNMNTGDGEHVMVGTLRVQGHEDCPEGDFTFVRKEHVAMIRDEKPYWLTQKYGAGILMPQANSTFLYGSLEWFVEMMCNRRNAVGQFRGLA